MSDASWRKGCDGAATRAQLSRTLHAVASVAFTVDTQAERSVAGRLYTPVAGPLDLARLAVPRAAGAIVKVFVRVWPDCAKTRHWWWWCALLVQRLVDCTATLANRCGCSCLAHSPAP